MMPAVDLIPEISSTTVVSWMSMMALLTVMTVVSMMMASTVSVQYILLMLQSKEWS